MAGCNSYFPDSRAARPAPGSSAQCGRSAGIGCNDVYREAAARGIAVRRVEVEVEGMFGAAGEPARGITYRARVQADAPEEQVRALLVHTDRVAEVQNTLRASTPVQLVDVQVEPTA